MSNTLFINNTSFIQNDFIESKLLLELQNETFSTPLVNVLKINNQAVVIFENEITAQDQEIVNLIVSQHLVYTQQEQIEQIVKAAISFGQNLIVEFASENVLMGITQAGKTKLVADYLADVMRYAQSGSLYEVINEVDNKITNGIPQELSPFVTETRLLEFKQKVLDYLS